jgi:hypothetical protein
MVLQMLGDTRSQEEIARTLKLRSGYGVPASNIAFLRTNTIGTFYQFNGTLDDIENWLQRGVPVIALVQAGELPHWRGVRAQHAVLIVGTSDVVVLMHDPALIGGPIAVPVGDFLLAWQEMDERYAVLRKYS